jgi:hypothetical protein
MQEIHKKKLILKSLDVEHDHNLIIIYKTLI